MSIEKFRSSTIINHFLIFKFTNKILCSDHSTFKKRFAGILRARLKHRESSYALEWKSFKELAPDMKVSKCKQIRIARIEILEQMLLVCCRSIAFLFGELFSSDFSATKIGMTSVKLVDKFCSEFSWTCCSFYAVKFVATILSNRSIFYTCRQRRRCFHIRSKHKRRTSRSDRAAKAPAANVKWTIFKWQLSVSER